MTDSLAINEARASLYWWFSTVLTKEVDASQLEGYFSGEIVALLDNLAQEPLFEDHVKTIKQALAKLKVMENPKLELAADFSELFLTDAKKGAPPYASVYLSDSGQLFAKPHLEMVEILTKKGLVVDPEFNEPLDHIAIQLDYIGNLIIKDKENVSQEQAEFISEQLLTWLPLWCDAMSKVNNTGFYQGVTNLLLAYIKSDLEALKA